MSPDPGPWIFLNPQSYNAYTYGLNNPLRYSDDSGETAQDRVNAANSFAAQSIPYISGGKDPNCGLDCSGLVENVFKADRDNKISVLDTVQSAASQSIDLQEYGYYGTDINNAQAGDAIFFSNSTGHIVHTGIAVDIKDGKVYFVHAPHSGPGEKVKKSWVSIKSLKFGRENFAGVGRPIEPLSSQDTNQNSTQYSNQNENNGSLLNSLSNLLENLFFNWTPPPPPTGTVCAYDSSGQGGCTRE